MFGQGATGPDAGSAAPDPRALFRSTVIAAAGLLALAALGPALGVTVLTPPLAATVVTIAAIPSTPFAQPCSVLGGHVCSAVLGLLMVAVAGSSPWAAAVAGALALTVMALVRAVHPPAAATALLIVTQHPAVLRTLESFTIGSVVLILVGIVAGRLLRSFQYPGRWW